MWTVAVQGWSGSSRATKKSEVTAGLNVMWVETPDGLRIDGKDIRAVTYHLDNGHEYPEFADVVLEFRGGSAYPRAQLDLLGGIEFVYVNDDGERLT